MTNNVRNMDSIKTQFRRPASKLEAFLVYNGAPNPDDDPADYFIYTKGARLA